MYNIIDESPVGVGKTYRAIERMTAVPGRYVFATERVDSMDECANRIFQQARHLDRPLPVIDKIYSEKHGRKGSVARRIADTPRNMADYPHVISLITHEGLMSSDFSGFEGWTLFVDEVPTMFAMHEYETTTDLAFFEENYTLSSISGIHRGGWRMVGLTEAGARLDASSIASCEGHKYLHHFHRRCRDPRRGPIVNLEAWSDMTVPGRTWVWYSLFQPSQIAAFSERYFLGNGFTKSLAFKLFDDQSIEWDVFSDHGSRELKRRHARIVFYSERPTSLSYFESEVGRGDLALIAQHVASSTTGSYFWSSNEAVKSVLSGHLDPSSYRRPRQAGTSLLMNHHTAAMFYAVKPSREVEQAIRGLGCEGQDWVVTNEYETVLQFVTRTSVRDVTSTQDVVLHVFNREQADYVKAFFDAQPHITATLEKVDLDLSTQERKPPGRKKQVLTKAERQAKDDQRRVAKRLGMAASRARNAAAASERPAV